MTEIDRRKMLVGSGLALATGGCTSQEAPCPPPPVVRIKSFEPSLNKGDPPWAFNVKPGFGEGGKKLIDFKPHQICVLYISIDPGTFAMDVARFHFGCVETATTWMHIEGIVSKLINQLNGQSFPKPQPGQGAPWEYKFDSDKETAKYWLGLKDFAFSEQHHLVIYIRNQGIFIHKNYPIWFGSYMHDKILGYNNIEMSANKNYSFYEADDYPITVGQGHSPTVIHAINRYQYYDTQNEKYEQITVDTGIGAEHRRLYSMNINIFVRTSHDGVEIPIMLDPDTGNMGEGQP